MQHGVAAALCLLIPLEPLVRAAAAAALRGPQQPWHPHLIRRKQPDGSLVLERRHDDQLPRAPLAFFQLESVGQLHECDCVDKAEARPVDAPLQRGASRAAAPSASEPWLRASSGLPAIVPQQQGAPMQQQGAALQTGAGFRAEAELRAMEAELLSQEAQLKRQMELMELRLKSMERVMAQQPRTAPPMPPLLSPAPSGSDVTTSGLQQLQKWTMQTPWASAPLQGSQSGRLQTPLALGSQLALQQEPPQRSLRQDWSRGFEEGQLLSQPRQQPVGQVFGQPLMSQPLGQPQFTSLGQPQVFLQTLPQFLPQVLPRTMQQVPQFLPQVLPQTMQQPLLQSLPQAQGPVLNPPQNLPQGFPAWPQTGGAESQAAFQQGVGAEDGQYPSTIPYQVQGSLR